MKNKRKHPRWSKEEQELILFVAGMGVTVIIIVLLLSNKFIANLMGWAAAGGLLTLMLWAMYQSVMILWLRYRADHQDDNLIENEQQVKEWVSQVQIKTSDCTQIANTEDGDIIQTQINTTGGTQIIE